MESKARMREIVAILFIFVFVHDRLGATQGLSNDIRTDQYLREATKALQKGDRSDDNSDFQEHQIFARRTASSTPYIMRRNP